MFKTSECIKNDKGFTLVELMVTVLLTAIAVISIYRGYTAFSQSADAQQQVMEMQQNLRIGMTRLAADIRRAGMNEEGDNVAGFIAANATSVAFSMDFGSGGVFEADGLDNDDDGEKDNDPAPVGPREALEESRIGDGDVCDDGEKIRYTLSGGDLKREVGDSTILPCPPGGYKVPPQTIITNVEALDFVYFNDSSATPLTVPLDATDLTEVDRVEITLVVRATNEDYRYNDNVIYSNLQGTPLISNKADNFRRRVFSMSVQIRNNI